MVKAALHEPILRDAGYYHVNASALYALEELVKVEVTGPGQCGRLSDRNKLSSVMCVANDQLSAYRGKSWENERQRFDALRQRLLNAGCLVSVDPCAVNAPAVVADAAPIESAERDELEAESPLEFITEADQRFVESSLTPVPLQ